MCDKIDGEVTREYARNLSNTNLTSRDKIARYIFTIIGALFNSLEQFTCIYLLKVVDKVFSCCWIVDFFVVSDFSQQSKRCDFMHVSEPLSAPLTESNSC